MNTKTYTRGNYRLVLDKSRVVPEDPGSDTPAMVYGPNGSSGTYWCACDTGELSYGDRQLPNSVVNWLIALLDDVDAFLYN